MPNSDLDFIKAEKDSWGKVFVDITYAIDNTAPFLSEKTLKIRRYANKLDVLKKYVDLLDSSESEINASKKNFFKGLFEDKEKYQRLLCSYKANNKTDMDQLNHCSKCSCLNCIQDCDFNSCIGCREGSYIKKCDHEKLNITVHDYFTLDLTNNNTGRSDKYKVLATMQDCEVDRQYIVLENINNKDDKFILYYYPGISSDKFDEITDASEFDFIVENYQNL